MDTYYIYILTSRHHKYISINVTGELHAAIQNQRKRVSRSLKRKRVYQKLVYVEAVKGVDSAVHRHHQLRNFDHLKLVRLIESVNPCWDGISLSALSKSGYSHMR